MKTKILILSSLIIASFSFNTKAQTDKEMLEFAHSGKVTMEKNIVKVPIEIWNDFILLKVKVEGKDLTFMWDSGFSFSGIDNSHLQSLHFQPFTPSSQQTATDGNNNKVNLNFLICPSLQISDITIKDSPFVKIDAKTIFRKKDLYVDGIIGASVINKLNWKFNFDQNYVEISERPFQGDSSTIATLPFRIIETGGMHIMPISFNSMPTEAFVDFGYDSDIIMINTANANHFSKSKAWKSTGPTTISVSGISPSETAYTIDNGFDWELSGKKFDFTPTITFSKTAQNITIGNKFFREKYNLVINTTSNPAFLLNPRVKPILPLNNKSFGYTVYNIDNKLKIVKITYNPNTDKNDIKLMDEVISINGKGLKDFEDSYSLSKYQDDLLKSNKQLIIKLKSGKEIILLPQPNTLFDYKNDQELW